MSAWVITAVGPDRPGLVERITKPLLETSSNVGDSRMINLRGQFALILFAEIAEASLDPVKRALGEAARELDLAVAFHGPSQVSTGVGPATVGVPYRLRIFAMDQPGIVHRITDVLQRSLVNVEELETRSQPRPHSGAPLFSLELRMTVPAERSIRALREELTAVCDALNCDLELVRDSLA